MEIITTICQIIVALGLLNVWLLRRNQSTSYRGGNAKNMSEEFAAYGLSETVMRVVGTLKVAAALALIAGIFLPTLVAPAAGLLIVLMLGALVMHAKVKDPITKSLPAASVLALSILILFGTQF